jgi:hypothetical protein
MCVVPEPLDPTRNENTILSTDCCVYETSNDRELTLPDDTINVEKAPMQVLFAKIAAVIVLEFTDESTVIVPLKIINEPDADGDNVRVHTELPSVICGIVLSKGICAVPIICGIVPDKNWLVIPPLKSYLEISLSSVACGGIGGPEIH